MAKLVLVPKMHKRRSMFMGSCVYHPRLSPEMFTGDLGGMPLAIAGSEKAKVKADITLARQTRPVDPCGRLDAASGSRFDAARGRK